MSVSEPTWDDYAGMQWWNEQDPYTRRYWLEQANSARPVDAFYAYLREHGTWQPSLD